MDKPVTLEYNQHGLKLIGVPWQDARIPGTRCKNCYFSSHNPMRSEGLTKAEAGRPCSMIPVSMKDDFNEYPRRLCGSDNAFPQKVYFYFIEDLRYFPEPSPQLSLF